MAKKMTSGRAARKIDHAVLPVRSLAAARDRLEMLGFTVAPDAQHPFGTENCCVYFEDGTFLEPLAAGKPALIEKTALGGNVFTARDIAYRFRRGEDGFSALVFAADDAAADHKAFKRAGISPGCKLAFSRKFSGSDGKQDKASFLLAFAADPRAPDAFFFTCERVHVPKVDRRSLEQHENGAIAVSAAVMSEPNPADFRSFVQSLARQGSPSDISGGLEFPLVDAGLELLDTDALKARYGVDRGTEERGLLLEGIVLAVRSLPDTTAYFEKHEIAHRIVDNRVVLDRAAGQGAFFAFTEQGAA